MDKKKSNPAKRRNYRPCEVVVQKETLWKNNCGGKTKKEDGNFREAPKVTEVGKKQEQNTEGE